MTTPTSDSKSRHTSPDKMKKLLYTYLDSENLEEEFEIRFGTKGIKRITKIDFDNVIQYLISKGFLLEDEQQTLKIRSEYLDQKTGRSKISNIRTEINGSLNIQAFCRSNEITDSNGRILPNIKFTQKTSKRDAEGRPIRPAEFDDFNFRATYQDEKKLPFGSGLVKQLVNDWADKKKLFRLITRYSLTSYKYPLIRVDVSMVRASKTNQKGNMVPTYNIKDSEVLTNPETYEIEIEVVRDKYTYFTKEGTLGNLRKTIKFVLSGLQQTNYPISYTEMKTIIAEYMRLIHGKDAESWARPKNFIGPSSISLELKNIQTLDDKSVVPNIREPYTVTDKADGIRKILYVNAVGKIYLISTNMTVQFTGLITESKQHFNSLLDGEHILNDKSGDFINLYAAFDIYFIQGDDQRTKQFVNIEQMTTATGAGGEAAPEIKVDKTDFRLNQLATFVATLKPKSVASGGTPMAIERKTFEVSPNPSTIFGACRKVLERIDSDLYKYETDGLIFTPCKLGVGMSPTDEKPFNIKRTWMHSFKWKPPEFNTVDFLVSTKKDESGHDIISNIFENGKDMTGTTQLTQYKTLILRVGFDEKKHGYVNPCKDVIDDNVPMFGEKDDVEGYRPMPFIPSNPTDTKAYLCNVILKNTVGDDKHMFVEDGGESFGDNTIVEFKYVMDNKDGWKWVPIRVRYDKTAEFRSGIKNYGNAYHVAQSVWSSIHNPITKNMLGTGENIPEYSEDEDVYYNRVGKSDTRALRDFHNLYVKRKLILGAAVRGGTLIDLAVGKGGDFSKWIAAKLKFVFGVDISKDNIENRLDGACARYLNYRKMYKQMPRALFVNATSNLNIRSGEACFSEKGKEIVSAITGKGPKDIAQLGKGVYRQYGVGKDGFNVVSCQFAIHYFFQNPETLHNFLQNVSENCVVGGYFIGTSYDGKEIFRELRDKEIGDSISEYKNEKKIWEISKGYETDVFENDSSSIGLAIDVYQESINKVFREYLVNYDYLTQLLQHYGFELVDRDSAKKMGLPNGTGMFSELYSHMMNDIQRQKRMAARRGKTKTELEIGTAEELKEDPIQKRISFLNRYFVYRKVNDVNAEKIKHTMLGSTYEAEEKIEEAATEEVQKVAKSETKKKKKKVTKLKKTLKLKKPLKLKIVDKL